MADTTPIETFTGADGFGGSNASGAATSAATTGVQGTSVFDTIGKSVNSFFSDKKNQDAAVNAGASVVTAGLNLLGVQTPDQQAAAAKAAADAQRQQQTMMLVGGAVVAVVVVIVVVVLVRRRSSGRG